MSKNQAEFGFDAPDEDDFDMEAADAAGKEEATVIVDKILDLLADETEGKDPVVFIHTAIQILRLGVLQLNAGLCAIAGEDDINYDMHHKLIRDHVEDAIMQSMGIAEINITENDLGDIAHVDGQGSA